MPPRPPLEDGLNVGGPDLEVGGQVARSRPLVPEPADLHHVRLTQLGPRPRFTQSPSAMPEHVIAVRLLGVPSEVFQTVVGGVAIPVAADCTRGTRAVERFQDEVVDVPSRLLSLAMQIDDEVSARAADRLQGEPVARHPAPATAPVPARLDLAVPIDAIAWKSIDVLEVLVHAPM